MAWSAQKEVHHPIEVPVDYIDMDTTGCPTCQEVGLDGLPCLEPNLASVLEMAVINAVKGMQVVGIVHHYVGLAAVHLRQDLADGYQANPM